MSPTPNKQLASLEKRCRMSTGMVLAGIAFVASYGMIIFGESEGKWINFYPMFLAALFYIAGDLLALIWIRVVAGHIKEMLLNQLDEYQADGAFESNQETVQPPPQVDVIRSDGEGE